MAEDNKPPDKSGTISTESLLTPNGRLLYSVGDAIHNYVLLEEIGVGSLGKVFLAEQKTDFFTRQVALKIVRKVTGTLSEPAVQSQLEHPYIARLYECGLTEDGDLFIAMEFAEGEKLNERHEDLGALVDELDLFLKICEAVDFAHEADVVHGDLKPANILILDSGDPKLLDFGAALLLGREQPRVQAFTPAYASPELIDSGKPTIASDIFALGTILGEMLQPILDGGSAVDPRGSDELRCIIDQATSVKPGDRHARVADLIADLEKTRARITASSQRHLRFAALAVFGLTALAVSIAFVTRDSWLQGTQSSGITQLSEVLTRTLRMRGTEASGDRMAALLSDVEAQIDSVAPIGSPSRADLLVALGEGYLNLGYFQEAYSVLQKAEPLVSVLESEDAIRLATLLVDAETRVGLYEQAKERATNELLRLAGQPLKAQQVDLELLLAELNVTKGSLDRAESTLRSLKQRTDAEMGPGSLAAAKVACQLGSILVEMGKHQEAEVTLKHTMDAHGVALYEEARGRTCPHTYAFVLRERGDFAGAASLLSQLVSTIENAYGPNHRELAAHYRGLARCEVGLGRYTEAMSWLNKIDDLGAQVPALVALTVRQDKGRVLQFLGSLDDAEKILLDLLKDVETELGEEHFARSYIFNDLALVRLKQRRPTEAADLLRESLTIQQAIFPETDATVAWTQATLAQALLRSGHRDQGNALLDTACNTEGPHLDSYIGDAITVREHCAIVLNEASAVPSARQLEQHGAERLPQS